MVQRYGIQTASIKEQYTKLLKTMEQRQLKADIIKNFISEISELDKLPIEFNERLWHSASSTNLKNPKENIEFSLGLLAFCQFELYRTIVRRRFQIDEI